MFSRVCFALVCSLCFLCMSCNNSTIGGNGKNDLDDAYIGAEDGDFTAVLAALENGLKIDQPDKEGKTLLHHAVLGDQQKLAMKLIEDYKANVNVKDKDGFTPLTYAEDNQNEAISSMLKTAGATE